MQAKDIKNILIGTAFTIVGGSATLFSNYLISIYFPVRPIADDVMFKLFPHVPALSVIADGIITFTLISTIFVFTKLKSERIAQVGMAIGTMFFIRSILNFVTPLGDPSGDVVRYGFLERFPLLGMFPSGHMASMNFEFWLLTLWGYSKKWRYSLVLLMIAESIALWSTRGHYTIDIIGGIVLGYFVVEIVKKLDFIIAK